MSKLRRRLASTAVIVTGVLLLLPAAGQASQVFGTNLELSDMQPNQPNCAMLGPCTIAGFVEKRGENQLSSEGAPINGVITKFRIKPKVENTATEVTFLLADVNPVEDGEGHKSAKATAAAAGPKVTLPVTPEGQEPILEFPARVSVKKGQHLALDSASNVVATSDSNGGKNSYEFTPPLAVGSGEKTSTGFLGFLLVQAAVEPDADGDGFGDETQDGCPSQKGSQGACDRTKPTITGFRVKRGKITYRLSEPATVRIALAKRTHRRFKQVGRKFNGPGKDGANKVGVPHARHLVPGTYRVTLTATDAAGNRTTKSTGFVVRG